MEETEEQDIVYGQTARTTDKRVSHNLKIDWSLTIRAKNSFLKPFSIQFDLNIKVIKHNIEISV